MFRLTIFYGKGTLAKCMALLGIFVCITKGFGDFIGIYVSWTYATSRFGSPSEHPLYSYIAMVLAFAGTLEGIFSVICSISFLLYLTNFKSDSKDWRHFRSRVFKKEGIRLGMIVILQMVLVSFGIWVAFNDNSTSHVVFFFPSVLYSLEVHTFLELSYNAAKQILNDVKNSMLNCRDSFNVPHAVEEFNFPVPATILQNRSIPSMERRQQRQDHREFSTPKTHFRF